MRAICGLVGPYPLRGLYAAWVLFPVLATYRSFTTLFYSHLVPVSSSERTIYANRDFRLRGLRFWGRVNSSGGVDARRTRPFRGRLLRPQRRRRGCDCAPYARPC